MSKLTWLEHEAAAEKALQKAIDEVSWISLMNRDHANVATAYAAVATAHATLALIRMPSD